MNNNQETWIDTFNPESNDKDYREGARIEIQALFLNMLKLMNMFENYLANKFVKKNDKLVQGRIDKTNMDTDILEEEMQKDCEREILKDCGW